MRRTQSSILDALDSSKRDFTVVLSLIVFRIGYRMLVQLAEVSDAMQDELCLIEKWLQGPDSQLYGSAYESE